MHHPRSISAARRLRIASLLLLINRLLVPIAIGLLLVSLMTHDRTLMIFGLIVVGIGSILVVVQWMVASRAGCPLCRTPVLAPMRCMKHRKARHALGSYQLRVAIAIMFTEQFRCPYCNEPTAMDVKERISGSRLRGIPADPNNQTSLNRRYFWERRSLIHGSAYRPVHADHDHHLKQK